MKNDRTNITTELTCICDCYLLPEYKEMLELGLRTYLTLYRGRFYLRFPGATRGVVDFDDDGTITRIVIDEQSAISGPVACYASNIKKAVIDFVGQNVYEGEKEHY